MNQDLDVVIKEKLLIRPARAAVLLDLSKSKIYDAINKGEIPAVRIGGALRVDLSALRKMIEERSGAGEGAR